MSRVLTDLEQSDIREILEYYRDHVDYQKREMCISHGLLSDAGDKARLALQMIEEAAEPGEAPRVNFAAAITLVKRVRHDRPKRQLPKYQHEPSKEELLAAKVGWNEAICAVLAIFKESSL